ncbi:DegV family protein [Staphylospora marina]|uniref:DegV family protein n=1 Tax=Staphylospora marina TaxID=2490858 RepID=UPI000F5BAF1E|nr:DegV family protein [Staphylospora marina]
MAQVKIIADSTSDIPKHLADGLGISIVPIYVNISGKTYEDGRTISPGEFYEMLKTTEQLPTTSQPSPTDIADVYREAIREGSKEILSLHISSKMSGTYQSALLAKSMIEEEQEGVRIHVLDTRTVTYAFGVIVLLTARAAKEGKSLDELVRMAERIREKQALVALVDTLEYLQKGGRIGKAAALVGSLLNIKPIISISDDGEVTAIDKARGRKKAFSRAFELLRERVPGGAVHVGILHANEPEQAKVWLEKVKEMYDVRESVIADIGPAVGTHAGPGTVGCLLVPLDDL